MCRRIPRPVLTSSAAAVGRSTSVDVQFVSSLIPPQLLYNLCKPVSFDVFRSKGNYAITLTALTDQQGSIFSISLSIIRLLHLDVASEIIKGIFGIKYTWWIQYHTI